MHPVLLNLGPITIHTYGFLIALGFLSAVWLNKRLAVASQINPDRMIDLTFWCLISGFVGARILFIITRLSYFLADPVSMLRVWEGGLVFWGGPLVALPVGIYYIKKHKMPLWKTMDVAITGLVIGHAFGRVGCFFAGCCYGKPTGSSWGVVFHSDLVDQHLLGIPLHPTQLYESTALFILLAGLLSVFRRRQFDGQVVLTYFMAYPIIRSIIEIYRGDVIRGFVIQDVLSTSQFISILVFLSAAFALIYRLKQVRQQPQTLLKGARA